MKEYVNNQAYSSLDSSPPLPSVSVSDLNFVSSLLLWFHTVPLFLDNGHHSKDAF